MQLISLTSAAQEHLNAKISSQSRLIIATRYIGARRQAV
jgi:hypothetical protein